MSKQAKIRSNDEFSSIMTKFCTGDYNRKSPQMKAWDQSNAIIVELDKEKYLRQTRYSHYDYGSSKQIDEEEYQYILDNQTDILYIYENGSYQVINSTM